MLIGAQQEHLLWPVFLVVLHSGVTAKRNDIFLESAFFAPLAILGKARQYGLHTDASHRYERGIDPTYNVMPWNVLLTFIRHCWW